MRHTSTFIPEVTDGWTAGGVTIFVTLLLFAIVAAIGLVLLVRKLLIPGIRAILADLGAVKHQVVNDHSTNLRVEADERHSQLVDQLNILTRSIEGIRDDVRDQRRTYLDRPSIDAAITEWHRTHPEAS